MDYGELDGIIAPHGAAHTVSQLEPYITEQRKLRIEQVLSGRLDSVHVAVECPEDPHNAAAVVRTAEALGLLHVHAISVPTGTLHAHETTQGSYYWLHTYHHRTPDDFFAAVRARGARVIGAAMDGQLSLDELPVDAPLCVLFGNERVGLSEAVRARCDATFHIPMVGMSESLNLSVSAAITLYNVTRERRRLLGASSDLDADECMRLRARYYARSVERRLLLGLLEQP